jgi:hypothetical protein
VKGQSNWEIARTPRNAFRGSLVRCLREVELPIGSEGFAACQFQTNSECAQSTRTGVSRRVLISGGERVRAQTSGQGPQERSKLRRNEVAPQRQPGC